MLEITVTPDRGYAVSIRGVARELASAYQVPYTDPAQTFVPGEDASGIDEAANGGAGTRPRARGPPRSPTRPPATGSCSARSAASTRRPARRCGCRSASPAAACASVSLAVDVTNYLMLELGQPLHAFDRSKLHGTIVVRRARPGETLITLDHVTRALHEADILITDDSGPISMAGTMGGLATEIDDDSTDIVIEGAHFSDTGTAKMSRRHRLHSEASYRFERGTDRELPLRATARAAALLARLGGATVVPGATHAQVPVEPVTIQLAADYPDRVAGVVYGMDTVVARLQEVGCEVRSTPASQPPTVAPARRRAGTLSARSHGARARQARPPAHDPAGHAAVVASRPHRRRRPGRGGHPPRRLQQRPGQAAARHGGPGPDRAAAGAAGHRPHARRGGLRRSALRPVRPGDRGGQPHARAGNDPRRPAVKVANPLSEDQPQLRTTLLPGLFRTMVRNIGRGFPDTALFETGQVFLPRPGSPGVAPILAIDRGPTEAELATLAAALPDQPQHVAGVLTGNRELPGWWGPGRPQTWADAIEAARQVGAVSHLSFEVRAAAEAPWHPGRCAALYVRVTTSAGKQGGQEREWLAGHAGELHPRVIAAYGLPPRTSAFELDFAVLAAAAAAAEPVRGPALPAYPLATQDVALVVPEEVPAADVVAALRAGAGGLLEDVRLFDVYTGAQLGAGRKSLAYTLRLRAPDRTLTAAEATAARDAAVAEAARRTGAVLRAVIR